MSNKILGYYIFGGMLIGAFFGLVWAANANMLAGLGTGALVGAFLGWFIGAAVLESQKTKKESKPQ